jgi:hypothetical protein
VPGDGVAPPNDTVGGHGRDDDHFQDACPFNALLLNSCQKNHYSPA